MVARVIADMPVTERRIDAAGVDTSLLEGGVGPPIVLLHGQAGFAEMWGLTLPYLVRTHRVVAPDLPGLGRSTAGTGAFDPSAVIAWLRELIEVMCDEPPTLVGQSLGGSIAARFAIEHGDRLSRLVLVDSGSLGRFRPASGWILPFVRFSARPSPANYERLLGWVFADPERARAGWGERWGDFQAYHIDLAAQPSVRSANRRLLKRLGIRQVPPDQLERIEPPVVLIWGRDDQLMRFRIAERASARFGWPLRPIDDCGHAPHIERPQDFLEALRNAMEAHR